MSGSSNFQQWNPTESNQETDSQYLADSSRSSGVQTNSIFPSQTANKLFYQVTTFIAAFAQALAAKGYVLSDGNVTTLASILANVVTQVDLMPYALLSSPTLIGTPSAPTPVTGDNTTKIATTAFVKVAVAALQSIIASGAVSLTSNGYVTLPGVLLDSSSSLTIQWMSFTASGGTNSYTFPIPFSTTCLFVGVAMTSHPADLEYSVTYNNSEIIVTSNVSAGYGILAIGY